MKDDDKKIKESFYYFSNLIQDNNPNHLEIGMGKGNFIINNALKHPNINFYGIDKYPTVILKCINKLKLIPEIPNLKVLWCDAIEINKYFPNNSFKKIYLNFSDPWPKKRHEKRRLTSNLFLDQYKKLLIKNGTVEFKTDNTYLYEYTMEVLKSRKDTKIVKHYDDLYKKFPISKLIQTEYETKFIKLGIKIKYISFKFI